MPEMADGMDRQVGRVRHRNLRKRHGATLSTPQMSYEILIRGCA